jgi:hypothetical protein
MLDYLIEDEAITEMFVDKPLAWEHSGFSVDNTARVGTNDPRSRRQLAHYMIRNPFSLEKMEYQAKQDMMAHRTRYPATPKRSFQIMPGVTWLKLLLQLVPDRGKQLVRYYGWYSNRRLGQRKKTCRTTGKIETDAAGRLACDPDTPDSLAATTAGKHQQQYRADDCNRQPQPVLSRRERHINHAPGWGFFLWRLGHIKPSGKTRAPRKAPLP